MLQLMIIGAKSYNNSISDSSDDDLEDALQLLQGLNVCTSSYAFFTLSSALAALMDISPPSTVPWQHKKVILGDNMSGTSDDDLEDVAASVLVTGKDTISICLITGFESFNSSLYTKVSFLLTHYAHFL